MYYARVFVILEWKSLSMIKTLAYYEKPQFTDNFFYNIGPWWLFRLQNVKGVWIEGRSMKSASICWTVANIIKLFGIIYDTFSLWFWLRLCHRDVIMPKKFYQIGHWCQFYKLFLSLTPKCRINKLERFSLVKLYHSLSHY